MGKGSEGARTVHDDAKSKFPAPVTPAEGMIPQDPREDPEPIPGRRDGTGRTGSRILLAVALAGGVVAAIIAGAVISDFLCDVAGVTSTNVRLGVKVASVAAALPAGFYLVERYFLSRSSRGPRNP
jgi:hypothetical protein